MIFFYRWLDDAMTCGFFTGYWWVYLYYIFSLFFWHCCSVVCVIHLAFVPPGRPPVPLSLPLPLCWASFILLTRMPRQWRWRCRQRRVIYDTLTEKWAHPTQGWRGGGAEGPRGLLRGVGCQMRLVCVGVWGAVVGKRTFIISFSSETTNDDDDDGPCSALVPLSISFLVLIASSFSCATLLESIYEIHMCPCIPLAEYYQLWYFTSPQVWSLRKDSGYYFKKKFLKRVAKCAKRIHVFPFRFRHSHSYFLRPPRLMPFCAALLCVWNWKTLFAGTLGLTNRLPWLGLQPPSLA